MITTVVSFNSNNTFNVQILSRVHPPEVEWVWEQKLQLDLDPYVLLSLYWVSFGFLAAFQNVGSNEKVIDRCLLIILFFFWYVLDNIDQSTVSYEVFSTDPNEEELPSGTFTLRQIKFATDDFNPANKIGEGGFGAVFKVKDHYDEIDSC